MKTQKSKNFGSLILTMTCLFFISGCLGIAQGKLTLKPDSLTNQKTYEAIKKIIIEEAANCGFDDKPTNVVKPSEHNDWIGKIFFEKKTPFGHDTFTVRFNKQELNMVGGGFRVDSKTCIKSITARINKL